MKKPCKHCNFREVGCHDGCNQYIEFRKTIDKVKERRAEERGYMGYVTDAIRRMKG